MLCTAYFLYISLVPNGHSSLSTVSDMKMETVCQLQFCCFFSKRLINKVFTCYPTTNPTAAIIVMSV